MNSEALFVANYLRMFGALPDRYKTKSEVRRLGWRGGNIEKLLPGTMIGGDKYFNRSGALPTGNYMECDIGTLGMPRRGKKRLVYSDDYKFFYTNDHYLSFEEINI